MGIAGPLASSYFQKEASDKASDTSKDIARKQLDFLQEMFEYQKEQQAPYQALGERGVRDFGSISPTGDADKYLGQYEGLSIPQAPELASFNFELDTGDPIYQWKLSEAQKAVDQAAAARGNYNSRAAINASRDASMQIAADEAESQYTRALQTYGINQDTTLKQYGLDTDQSTREAAKITDLYNMSTDIAGADYNKILDAIKIGQGAASATGSAAQATGQGVSSAYSQLGSTLSQLALNEGDIYGDLASGLDASAMNWFNIYNANQPGYQAPYWMNNNNWGWGNQGASAGYYYGGA